MLNKTSQLIPHPSLENTALIKHFAHRYVPHNLPYMAFQNRIVLASGGIKNVDRSFKNHSLLIPIDNFESRNNLINFHFIFFIF